MPASEHVSKKQNQQQQLPQPELHPPSTPVEELYEDPMKDGNTVDGDEDEYEYIAESEQRRGRGQLPNPNARY